MASGLLTPQLPITGTFAVPLGLYYVLLSGRVVAQRLQSKKLTDQPVGGAAADTNGLAASIRAQVNFAENVPLALILAGIVELNGGSRRVLTGALSVLVAARVLHAHFGLLLQNSSGFGRPIGYLSTQGVVVGLVGYSAYLLKSFWGY
ncbi:uncharacterized protein K489DRAFT_370804 [Dissoconium aciculare CBS 342.82]|uniref:Membrane-associated proteins in eicosanoid and glutathione metabolism n=1 Tax=Dissoconium aciculare CBS 342.82 TaxID=1314786 RepID=A0A6J3M1J3_9PEZI|nr:uncharacterized protein K489DRAFT_370804 [Dissoconium aciculare CBS 342.82]KAF1821900.1 hypothetical protein K489DRAFT_370804 [Dissoconium aciculare CBS 342.82]